MFSRISDFLKPFGLQKEAAPAHHGVDAARKDGGGKNKKGRGETGGAQDQAPEDDVTLISVEAIRRLLQEGAPAKDAGEKIAFLARLEQHGIKSVPVREGQSVWSALDDAGRFL